MGSSSATGPYDPHIARKQLKEMYDAENVLSTTVPRSNDKNVKLKGQQHPNTDIVYDSRGYPIFDDIAKYDTKLPEVDFNNANYPRKMSMASKD
ncbi:TPA: hypothetical protein QH394_000325 [Klebsiella aerogenes]|nr:hypothetical protein [Klebsiella aerogenes]